MEILASELTAGQHFTYGAHDYVASAVSTVDGITSVTIANGYAMDFYADSTVTVAASTGCVGYNGWKVHVLTEGRDNTLCGARRDNMSLTVHRATLEVSCGRCIKIVSA